VTVWFWLAGCSYKGKLKKRKKGIAEYLIFLYLIKISIPITRSWRDLIGLRFLVVHIIIFFLFPIWIKIPVHPKSYRSNCIMIPSYIKRDYKWFFTFTKLVKGWPNKKNRWKEILPLYY